MRKTKNNFYSLSLWNIVNVSLSHPDMHPWVFRTCHNNWKYIMQLASDMYETGLCAITRFNTNFHIRYLSSTSFVCFEKIKAKKEIAPQSQRHLKLIKWKQSQDDLFHANYLLEWLYRLNTHKDTCGEQITGKRCTIRRVSRAKELQIVFSVLIVLYSFALIEHELNTDAAEQIKVYNRPRW